MKKLFVHKLDIPNDSCHYDFISNMISDIVPMFMKINTLEIDKRRSYIILQSDLYFKRSQVVFVGNINDLYGIHSDWMDLWISLFVHCVKTLDICLYIDVQ